MVLDKGGNIFGVISVTYNSFVVAKSPTRMIGSVDWSEINMLNNKGAITAHCGTLAFISLGVKIAIVPKKIDFLNKI